MVPGPLVYDAATGQLLAYDTSPGDTTGLWSFSSGKWVFVQDEPQRPAANSAAYLVFDKARQDVLLYQCSSTDSCATFTWDGATWIRHPTKTDPGYLTGASIAYDDARGVVLFFGGTDEIQQQSDSTWTWDGIAWSLLSPVTSPPSRIDAAMAFDPVSRRVLLYGGSTNFAPFGELSDMWAWDGRKWSPVSPDMSPSSTNDARVNGASMAYDVASRTMVMVVDRLSSTETWTWDGHAWSISQPSVAPPPGGSLTYDGDQRNVILTVNSPPCVFYGP